MEWEAQNETNMEATLLQIKKYFGEESSAKFAKEWKELKESDKKRIKEEVAKELGLTDAE